LGRGFCVGGVAYGSGFAECFGIFEISAIFAGLTLAYGKNLVTPQKS